MTEAMIFAVIAVGWLPFGALLTRFASWVMEPCPNDMLWYVIPLWPATLLLLLFVLVVMGLWWLADPKAAAEAWNRP